jgi:hypothetical protein
MHLQQVAWHVIGRRLVAIGLEAGDGLLAQVGQLVLRRVGGVAERLERPCAGQEEVALDQMPEPEIGVGLEQLFRLS